MKIKTIFTFAIACALGILAVSPAAAEEEILTGDKIKDLVIQGFKGAAQREKNYLQDSALGYLSHEVVYYQAFEHPYIFDILENCNKSETSDLDALPESAEIPACLQFDIMSSLIAKGDNENLQKVLDLGYDPRLKIQIDDYKNRNLYSQAVLSNNKTALSMLYNKIQKNGVDIYGKIDSSIVSTEKMMVMDLSDTLNYFISRNYWDKPKYDKNLSPADKVKYAVINGDSEGLRITLNGLSVEQRISAMFAALNSLIDYRIEQKY